ncbi:MAG: tRNA (adenosine(37)-N6)-threonylcarbamoyltransferase complex dimerization subunit type 1 TsaB [Gammaproteobacteria bacterium]
MKLLAIDTATEACSAALYLDGEIRLRYEDAPRLHAKLILGMADELLDEAGYSLAQLDALAIGHGPGSFTGVRIGMGVAQGMAMGADLGLIGVSDLAAVAQAMVDQGRGKSVAVAFDARMDEVYWGCYRRADDGLVVLAGEECVAPPEAVKLPDASNDWVGAGRGWAAYADRFREITRSVNVVDADGLPSAEQVAKLAVRGEPMPAENVLPVYLRDQVAWKKSG